ncbi:hypothetical protein HA145_06905 [Prochlorococcus marinus XMU1411]|uniref:hypothetical protein n=1 Tax=Prochlorococcus marinus TaxID=1219 RepID=UPI001AD96A8A|nr:hypothetical protein [Prochlorococcus marinus]MBO8244204.1 hypothetical protein [Prochlorococcus marinus XMU1411]MBW3055289.1 hypothetical protein [Prochlorococcus marinus str. MU1411]MCR8537032.1 hypothetical protein [Prochlorococcus marinus CUG1430]
MRLNKNIFWIILSIPIIAPILYFLQSRYTGGDQGAYWIFYEAVSDVGFLKVPFLGYYWLNAIEPIHLYLMWIGSAVLNIDKNLYVTIYNLVLVFGLYLFFQKEKVKVLPQILIFGNFYISVLLFAAERLKFAYILYIYAQLVPTNLTYLLILISPFAHLQSLVIVVSSYLGRLSEDLKKIFYKFTIRKNFIKDLIIFATIMSAFILFALQTFIYKIINYISLGLFSLNDFINFVILFTVPFLLIKEKFKFSLMYLPLIIPLIVLGGFRVNMISFTIASFFIIKEKKSSSPLYLLILSYFFYKNILFIDKILTYGTGF